MDGVPYGDYGVLAYDEVMDRVQCHACGGWYHMLTGEHLQRHGLTTAAYKKRYGLDQAMRLESSRVTASRCRSRALTEARGAGALPIPDDALHGERGVLAYDDLADRIQCHACGRWYRKLTSFHLKRHGLSIAAYKELYGLNDSTPLEALGLTALRRRLALERDAARYLIPGGDTAAGHNVWRGRNHRAEYFKKHQSPADRAANSRRQQQWTDEELLMALHRRQAERGGILTQNDLRRGTTTDPIRIPSHTTVIARFGSWRRVCELLDQPYRIGRAPSTQPGANRHWLDEEIIARLCDLRQRHEGVLTTSDIRRNTSRCKGVAGDIPSYRTIYARFGSWERVRALMDARDAGDDRDG